MVKNFGAWSFQLKHYKNSFKHNFSFKFIIIMACTVETKAINRQMHRHQSGSCRKLFYWTTLYSLSKLTLCYATMNHNFKNTIVVSYNYETLT